MRELVESVAVSLLTVRNAKGKRIVVPNPLRYAQMIAEDLIANPPPKKRALPPAPEVKAKVTWIDPGALPAADAMPTVQVAPPAEIVPPK